MDCGCVHVSILAVKIVVFFLEFVIQSLLFPYTQSWPWGMNLVQVQVYDSKAKFVTKRTTVKSFRIQV